MKHASPSTLQELAPLLDRLRSFDGLIEKRPGVFYRRSKAFLHFHEDPTGLFVDVRFHVEGDFDRLPVSTPRQQSLLVAKIERALSSKASATSPPKRPNRSTR